MRRSQPAGFTLIELLVVISVLATLMGLLFPLASLVKKRGNTTNTQSLLRKVEGAVRQFRSDIGNQPYRSYAAPYASATGGNRLGWFIAHQQDDAERTWLRNLLAIADSKFAPPVQASKTIAAPPASTPFSCCYIYDNGSSGTDVKLPWAYNPSRIIGAGASAALSDAKIAEGLFATRLGQERARVALLAGHADYAPPAWSGSGYVAGSAPVLSAADIASAKPGGGGPIAPPGWSCDYLQDDLPQRNRDRGDPEVIVDQWGTPLIYLSPVVQGGYGYVGLRNDSERFLVDKYLLQKQGRRSTTSAGDDQVACAAPGYEFEFEVWSAGPDRGFDLSNRLTGATVNADNIAATPYIRGVR